jgi:hypothetical protein
MRLINNYIRLFKQFDEMQTDHYMQRNDIARNSYSALLKLIRTTKQHAINKITARNMCLTT